MSGSGPGVISQKDYLRKYLSGSSGKKKKRRKPAGSGIKIIDDDVDISKMQMLDEGALDLYGYSEDAPQIVGIVDDRPEEVKLMEQKLKWKVVSQDDGIDSTMTVSQISQKTKIPKMGGESKSDSDLSPPRNNSDSDLSPERSASHKNVKSSSKDRGKSVENSDSDLSPERHGKTKKSEKSSPKSKREHSSRNEKRRDSDSSPARKRKHKNEKDTSPRRHKKKVKKDSDSDLSPERDQSKTKSKKNDSDSDLSPVRRDNVKNRPMQNDDRRDRKSRLSPPRNRERNSRRRSRWDNDDERPEHEDSHRGEENSQRRQDRNYNQNDSRESYRRNNNHESNNGKGNQHRDARDDRQRYEKNREEAGSSNRKSDKTLDGKRAGLQGAQQLKEETDAMKIKENEIFGKLSDEYTGRNAQAVKRNLRAGKRETEADIQEKKEKEAKRIEMEAKYSRWGKGIKQVEEQEERIKDYLHESSKPLARYRDDQDLDDALKGKERTGDPMLEYMRKKELEKGGVKTETKSFPVYQGPYPPNRFNIRPGHRWDGVDRSTGYEKNYFQTKNNKKALEEEMYKWSTEDM
ncbi:uncharacterized protein LOC143909899 [Arctopsyche grandis]|uniref:uncharacterized protein LOC143909899 n=1 Tax=Arctopsyche grandis TaxID=121162 RepID=UPI00406D9E1D